MTLPFAPVRPQSGGNPNPGPTGKLFAWGKNTVGILGLGNTTDVSSPVQVGTLNWSSVECGGYQMAGIRTTGALFTWGTNASGQLGDGTRTTRSSPVQVGTLTGWTAVAVSKAAGSSTQGWMLALRGGKLYSWGNNNYGQLGDGSTSKRSSPVQVGGLSTWTAIFAGQYHAAGIIGTKLYMWGRNTYGQLGLNDVTHRCSPVQVASAKTWSSNVALEARNSFALTNTGTLWAWGSGNNGALGDNTVTSKSSPVQIGSSTWTALAGGNGHTLGIVGGNIFGWGQNSYGQVGDGTTTVRSSPVQCVLAGSWTSIAIGGSGASSFAVRSGRLYGWGHNASGGLGLGDTTPRCSPAQVGSLATWFTLMSHGGGTNLQNNFLAIHS